MCIIFYGISFGCHQSDGAVPSLVEPLWQLSNATVILSHHIRRVGLKLEIYLISPLWSIGWLLTHWLPWGSEWNFLISNVQAYFSDWWLGHLLWNCHQMNVTGPYYSIPFMICWHWFWIMAWCHQATSNYLCQCWPGSSWPYGVTRH